MIVRLPLENGDGMVTRKAIIRVEITLCLDGACGGFRGALCVAVLILHKICKVTVALTRTLVSLNRMLMSYGSNAKRLGGKIYLQASWRLRKIVVISCLFGSTVRSNIQLGSG